jgi:hypothetical protein
VELEHNQSTTTLQMPDFEAIQELLRYRRMGSISVIRNRDDFEIFSGSISEARRKFGL